MTLHEHILRSFAVLLFIPFLASCNLNQPESIAPEEVPEAVQAKSPYVKGVVTVLFNEETAQLVERALEEGNNVATRAPQLGSVLEEMGVKSLRRVFPYAGEFEERTRREGMHRYYYVEFDESVPATRAAGDLSALPGVEHVSPQLPVRLRGFNDPYFGSQWHFVNTRYQGADINVQKVWDEFTVGRSDVIVSVVDEGVYMQHEDLAGNLVPCLEDGTGSFNFNNNTPTVVPTQGHGTHVAGVISAVSNNGIGVAGIAGGNAEKGLPGVRVMSCQIFDLYGNEPDLYQAIKHGADHGAVILQCSWGFSPDMDGDGFTTDEEIALYRSYTIDDLPEYKAAIDYFIKYAGCDNNGNQLPDSPMKGGVAVFASGNDNFDYDPLVSYEPVIAVGAFGATGNKASYSNWGDWLDIAAPGGDGKQGIYSTLLNNTYAGSDWQGTSMACPHVSGVAALLVSYFGGPGFTAEECRTRLVRGAVANFFTGSRYIGRKLDAYGAFIFDPNTPILPPVLEWAGTPPARLKKKDSAEVPFKVSDPGNQRISVTLSPELQGVTLLEDRIAIDASLINAGKYTFTLKAENEDHATATLTLEFVVAENQKPEIKSGLQSGLILDGPGQSLTIPLSDWYEDPDGDILSYEASIEDTDIVTAALSADGTVTLTAVKTGITKLDTSASDWEGSTGRSVQVAVRNPDASVWPASAVVEDNLVLYVDTATTVTVHTDIFSSTGAKVLSADNPGGIFRPVSISVDALAPGTYTARVSWEGAAYTVRFTKI